MGSRSANLSKVLQQAGAEVITEEISGMNGLGSAESAVAHVFIAALFRA